MLLKHGAAKPDLSYGFLWYLLHIRLNVSCDIPLTGRSMDLHVLNQPHRGMRGFKPSAKRKNCELQDGALGMTQQGSMFIECDSICIDKAFVKSFFLEFSMKPWPFAMQASQIPWIGHLTWRVTLSSCSRQFQPLVFFFPAWRRAFDPSFRGALHKEVPLHRGFYFGRQWEVSQEFAMYTALPQIQDEWPTSTRSSSSSERNKKTDHVLTRQLRPKSATQDSWWFGMIWSCVSWEMYGWTTLSPW